MIGNQRVEDLAKDIRKGEARIDLDNVRVRSPQGVEEAVAWPFSVTIEKGQFMCRWRVPQGAIGASEAKVMKLLTRRPAPGQVTDIKDHFRVFGVTNKGVAVEIEDLEPFPSVTTHSDGPSEYSTGCFSIKLPAAGLETWDSGRLHAHLTKLNPGLEAANETAVKHKKTETLFAIIPGVKLLIASSGTEIVTKHPFLGEMMSSSANCLIGEIHGGAYCVESKGDDLWVYYRRPLDVEAPPAPSADTVFDGILTAIGFTHGCHPWPYFRQHVRDHIVVDRWIRCCPDCVRDPLLPIENRRMFGSDDARELFRKACGYFSAGNHDTALTTRALWLMRESNRDSMPFEIRLVALCSILDGLIHRLGGTLLTKAELGKIKGELRSDERRRKWKLIAEHLQLPWDDVFEPAWTSWEQYRHPLAHGFNEVPEETTETIFDAYSRITGAIYILMARSMGYTGSMASSVLEEKRISLGLSPPTGQPNS